MIRKLKSLRVVLIFFRLFAEIRTAHGTKPFSTLASSTSTYFRKILDLLVTLFCMQVYKTKAIRLQGTDFHEVRKKAFRIYAEIRRRSRRSPYIRSAYFNKEKIFISIFWQHLWSKEKWQDRMRRLKYYAAAIELIEKTKFDPQSKENPNKRGEILHRFTGITKDNFLFHVQIKLDKKSRRKDFISVFPDA